MRLITHAGLVLVCICGCAKEPSDELPAELSPAPVEDGILPEPEERDSDIEIVEEPAPVKIERRESDFDAGRTADVSFVRLFADDFTTLEKKPRILAYHLARAVLAGRDITYDQLYRDNLEVRQVIECIHRANVVPDPEVEANLSDYLKHFVCAGIHLRFQV